jgi:hypothetical protein
VKDPPDKPRPPTRIATPTQVMTPRRTLPSKPDINVRLADHEVNRRKTLEELAQELSDYKAATAQTFIAIANHEAQRHRAVMQHLGEQDVAVVVTARAVGVKDEALPPELVKRSIPPPAEANHHPGKAPSKPPRAPLTTAKTLQILAVVVVVFETVKSLSDTIGEALKHLPH